MKGMVRRARRGKLVAINDAVMAALTRAGLSDQAKHLLIFQCWEKAVGPEIAARTSPQGFGRGVLRVCARSATWQNELTFLKADIIAKINQFLGQAMVRELKVVSGNFPSAGREAPAAAPKLPPLEPGDMVAARVYSADIKDLDVRQEFEKLFTLHRRARRRPARP
jgi:hypothetical protein